VLKYLRRKGKCGMTVIPDHRHYSLTSHGCCERYSDGVSYRHRENFI